MNRIGSQNCINFIPNIGVNVISGRVNAATSNWWNAGGCPAANCVAAYQAIRAASYAASLVNLANPGTYDLTETNGAIIWDAVNGWTGDGNHSFNTGIVPGSLNWSIAVQFADVGMTSRYLAGAYNGGTQAIGLCPNRGGTTNRFYHGNSADIGAAVLAGNLILAGKSVYLNGVLLGTIGAGGSVTTKPMHLLGLNLDLGYSLVGRITAASFYNANIAAYVAALSAAMAAL